MGKEIKLINNFSHRIFSIRLIFEKIFLKGSFPFIVISYRDNKDKKKSRMEIMTNMQIINSLDKEGRNLLKRMLKDVLNKLDLL